MAQHGVKRSELPLRTLEFFGIGSTAIGTTSGTCKTGCKTEQTLSMYAVDYMDML
jgi:hypothetical protein